MGKRFTILFSDEEHAELKRRAGLAPLGAWIRAQLLGVRELKILPEYTDFRGTEAVKAEPKKAEKKVCEFPTGPGMYCPQCKKKH